MYNNESSGIYVVAERSGSTSIQARSRDITYVAPGTDDWKFITDFTPYSSMITFNEWNGKGSSVNVPGDVLGANEVILSKTFRNNTRLERVTLPDDTSRLDLAFEGCTALNSITIPKSVRYISDRSFADCTSLRSVVFDRNCPLWSLKQNVFEGCHDLTIYGYGSNSGAYDIANQFGFPYVDLDHCLIGDADGNGVVEITDATAIQYHLANLNTLVEPAILMCGDVDGNGEPDITDANYIQRYIAQMKTPYPVGTNR